MPKIVSASEAKTRFGAIAERAAQPGQEVIVAYHGEPKVVIIAYADYQRYGELREEARRQEALGKLRALRDTVRARNTDLDEAAASALADRYARQVVGEMVAEGRVPYERE